MDQLVRILDILHDLPPEAVAGGAVVVVLVVGWLLARMLFRSPPKSAAVSMPPQAPLPQQSAPVRLSTEATPLSPDNRALVGFRKMLESKDVPLADQHALVREYANQLSEARVRLAEIAETDGSAEESLVNVQNALNTGEFDEALDALDKLGSEKTSAGREMRHEAERRLMAAALTRLVAGDLALAARDSETAERHYRLAIESLPTGADSLLAECLNKHGTAAYRANRLDVAAMSFRRAVKLLERLKGSNDGDVATALNNLAMLYYARGDYNAAEPLYRKALSIDEALGGENDANVATDLNNLALLLKQLDRAGEAEPLLKRALEIKERALEIGHPSLITGLRNYATVLRSLGREEEAEAFERRAEAMPSEDAVREDKAASADDAEGVDLDPGEKTAATG